MVNFNLSDRFIFVLNRLRERLWVKPLIVCILSIIGVFLAKVADQFSGIEFLPSVEPSSIKTLLGVLASSMLAIAVFAVGSMVSAYSTASSTATPRSFPLIVSDDVSQNALSVFVGAFIYSVVSLIAFENSYYDEGGRFALLALTLAVFAIVVVTFVRWVDRIARLGRIGMAISKMESVTVEALQKRVGAQDNAETFTRYPVAVGLPLVSETIGYIQRVDFDALEQFAEVNEAYVRVNCLPGAFMTPDRPLAYLYFPEGTQDDADIDVARNSFVVGEDRTFDEDPRFGLIGLAEIASKALSPGINDTGTAINIVGTLVRIFSYVAENASASAEPALERLYLPAIAIDDLFEDAFSTIERDGAAVVEVVVRLLKGYRSIAEMGDEEFRRSAVRRAGLTLDRARERLEFAADRERAEAAKFW
ncbi:MAG: DUF2254 domain-containing protein [Gammaproteobacteria bacterium]|nr:DUF2254 domain-containing protein [Gammaproteobacteria bacterium]